MAAATRNRKHAGSGTNQTVPPAKFDPPMAAATRIFQGTLVGVDTATAGFPAKPMSASATCKIRGIAQSDVDNSGGAQEDQRAPLLAETAVIENGSGGDTLTEAHLFGPVFALDDQTVANHDNTGARPCVGVLVGFDGSRPVVFPSPIWATLWDALRPFQSSTQTGSGSTQAIAHGLGVIPRTTVVEVIEGHDGAGSQGIQFPVVSRSVDATNVNVTCTAGARYRVLAWR